MTCKTEIKLQKKMLHRYLKTWEIKIKIKKCLFYANISCSFRCRTKSTWLDTQLYLLLFIKCQFFLSHNTSQKIHCSFSSVSFQNTKPISDLDFNGLVRTLSPGTCFYFYYPKRIFIFGFSIHFLILKLAVWHI